MGKQLPSQEIFSLLPEENGGLWIGTAEGLAHWTGNDLINYGSAGRINSIVRGLDGKIWVTRSRNQDDLGPLCEVDGEQLQCHGRADGISASHAAPLVQDSLGNFWMGSTDGLGRWQPGSTSLYLWPGLKYAHGTSGLESLAVAQDNSLWVGINRAGTGLGLERFTKGHPSSSIAKGFNGSRLSVNALFTDRDKDLWVGTVDEGIYRIRGSLIDHFGSSDGLSGDYINGFAQDNEGNLWVATSKGLDSLRDLPVATFSKRQGLTVDDAGSIVASSDGTILIGNSGALDLIADGLVSSLQTGHGLPGHQVTSMLEDQAGRRWIGIDNSLYLLRRGRFTPVLGIDGQPMGVVTGLAEDTKHNLWATVFRGPNNFLVQIEAGLAREELSPSQVPFSSSIVAARDGGIWLSAKGGGFTLFRNGLLDKELLGRTKAFGRVRDFLVNLDGSIWAASESGLIFWREGKLQLLSERNGLPCNRMHAVVRDNEGSLWINAQCGLIRLQEADLKRWQDKGDLQIKARTFDVFSGVQAGFATFRPRAARSPDGRVWFVNDSVVQMVDPNRLDLDPVPPPVHIEQLIAKGKSLPALDKMRLPPHTRDIEIDYTGLSFVMPRRVHFRYKLDGHDLQWQDAGTRRASFYTNLSPGAYTFHLVGCNNDNVCNEKGSALDFVIVPTWYQTWWFRFLCVLVASACFYSLYLLRMRQYAATMRLRFNERLDERTRIARELHDTLLQTIYGSKIAADHAKEMVSDAASTLISLERLSAWLDRASREGRAALESLRVSTIGAKSLVAALRSIAEECSTQHPMELLVAEIGEPRNMNPALRDEVYLIGYEAVRNAYNHSRGRHITITLTYDRNLTLRIRDDGCGMHETILRSGREGHFGLMGIRERALRIGATLTISSSAETGTEVFLLVPGRIIFPGRIPPLLTRLRRLIRFTDPFIVVKTPCPPDD
jgi:signal transduction histidine kinase/ligand-binding sensor domain-containing protein